MVLKSVGPATSKNVLLKDSSTGACVAVEVSGGPVVTSPSLNPVVEDVGVGVAVLLKLGETRSIAVVARADVDRSKVADDAGSPVVHVVVLDVEHVTSSVVLALLHRTRNPVYRQLVQKSPLQSPLT